MASEQPAAHRVAQRLRVTCGWSKRFGGRVRICPDRPLNPGDVVPLVRVPADAPTRADAIEPMPRCRPALASFGNVMPATTVWKPRSAGTNRTESMARNGPRTLAWPYSASSCPPRVIVRPRWAAALRTITAPRHGRRASAAMQGRALRWQGRSGPPLRPRTDRDGRNGNSDEAQPSSTHRRRDQAAPGRTTGEARGAARAVHGAGRRARRGRSMARCCRWPPDSTDTASGTSS